MRGPAEYQDILRWRKVYGVPGFRLAVRSNSWSFSEEFGRVFSHMETDGDVQVVYSVVVGRERHVLYRASEVLYETEEYRELVPALERLVEGEMVKAFWDRLVFHAGAVAKDGIVVVLPAEPGGGKTSLVAALLKQGFEYLSDEFAIIDPESLKVLPFPKGLCFKEGGIELFPHLKPKSLYVEWDMGGETGRLWYLDPLDLGPGVSREARRVRYIIFPERDGSEEIVEISKAKAILKLAGNLLNLDFFGRDLLDAMVELVRETECLCLRTGKPQEGARLIRSLVEEGG